MIRRSTLLAVEVLLGLIAALAIGLGVAWWRLSQGPVELGFLKQQIQTELSHARGGRPVGIQGVELAWTPSGALELRAVGVTVEDGRGHVLSRAQEARVELGVLPLLIGRISLVRADFIGSEITITHKATGATWVSFGPPDAPPDIIIPPAADESLEQSVNRLLDGLRQAFASVGGAGNLRTVSVRNADLTIVDEKSGARWHADAATLALARNGNELALTAAARLEGAQGLAPATLHISTDTAFQSAIIEFGAHDVRPRALFSPAALGPFAGLDAPVTANISVGLDRRAGVNRFEGDVVVGRGSAEMAGGRFNLEGGRVHGRYDINSDELIIDQLALAGEHTRVRGEARVRDASRILRAAPNEPAAFDITLPSMTLDVPGTFVAPLNFSNVQVAGAIVSADRSINFTHIRAETGQGVIEGTSRYYFAPAGPDHALHTGFFLDVGVAGSLTAPQVIEMWPMTLATGTHGYLVHTLRAGTVTNGHAHIDIRPSDSVGGPLRNDAINVTFDVNNAEMEFLDTMSPIVGARGSGVLRGNAFQLNIAEARMNNLVLSNGRIDVPRFVPHENGFITISAHADGDARRIMEVLLQRPLALHDRLPVDVTSVSGHGSVNLVLQRPMEKEVPFEAWRFNVNGQLQNFSGNMTGRRMAVSNGQLQIRGDQDAIHITGPIRAGTSNVQIAWNEFLNRHGRASSEYQISGDFDADDLVRLGYTIAGYAEGRVGVTISGQGRGFDVDQAQLEVDLRNAAVDSPWHFWTKRAGQAASARFTIARQPNGELEFDGIDARSDGMSAQGMVRIDHAARIMAINVPHLMINGRSNARLTALRAADGGLDVAVRGALFDAAPFMAADDSDDTGAASDVPRGPPEQAVRASVVVDALKMRGGVTLNNAQVSLAVLRGGLARLTATGTSPGNKSFSAALGPRPDDPQGRLVFRGEDAGFAVAALTGTPNIVGGTATADGDWHGGPPSSSHFTVHMRDFQVVRLPVMARLLSSAGSLTGLSETLNGEGIGFTALDAHVTFANNNVTFTDGRMTGPSLGLTGAGGYDMRRDNLTVDGVVAPSPVLNLSMLSNVPIIGDILTSRRGEGVFGMTYSVDGHAAAPRVGVNPVSALTPGILRRIFEPIQPRTSGTEAAPAPPSPQSATQSGAMAGASAQ